QTKPRLDPFAANSDKASWSTPPMPVTRKTAQSVKWASSESARKTLSRRSSRAFTAACNSLTFREGACPRPEMSSRPVGAFPPRQRPGTRSPAVHSLPRHNDKTLGAPFFGVLVNCRYHQLPHFHLHPPF